MRAQNNTRVIQQRFIPPNEQQVAVDVACRIARTRSRARTRLCKIFTNIFSTAPRFIEEFIITDCVREIAILLRGACMNFGKIEFCGRMQMNGWQVRKSNVSQRREETAGGISQQVVETLRQRSRAVRQFWRKRDFRKISTFTRVTTLVTLLSALPNNCRRITVSSYFSLELRSYSNARYRKIILEQMFGGVFIFEIKYRHIANRFPVQVNMRNVKIAFITLVFFFSFASRVFLCDTIRKIWKKKMKTRKYTISGNKPRSLETT